MEVLKKMRVGLLLAAAAVLIFSSCKTPVTSPHEGTVTFRVENLPVLPQDLIYEAWIIYPNGIESAGKFRVDANGNYSGSATALNLGTMVGFEVSIEPANDNDENISGAVVLAGVFESDSSENLEMTPWNSYAFGRLGFEENQPVNGKYFLHVYTDYKIPFQALSDSVDTVIAPFYKGLWLGEVTYPNQEDSVRKSFNLPNLENYWDYAAWIKDKNSGAIYLLGRFTDFGNADNDGPGPYPGRFVNNAPELPGGEFVTDSLEINLNSGNYILAITLQPTFVKDSILPVNGLPCIKSLIPNFADDLKNIDFIDTLALNWHGTVNRKY